MDFLSSKDKREKNKNNDTHVQNFDRKLQSMFSLTTSDIFYIVVCYCAFNLIQEPSVSLVLTKRIAGSRNKIDFYVFLRKNK